MHKLLATLIKDARILLRDKVGLTLMFAMPIVLVVVITSIQNSTFELVNDNKIKLLLVNKDNDSISEDIVGGLQKIGMFEITNIDALDTLQLTSTMKEYDALVALVIHSQYSQEVNQNIKNVVNRLLQDVGLPTDTTATNQNKIAAAQALRVYFNPVLQESYRKSIEGALTSIVRVIESKTMLATIYNKLGQEQPKLDLSENINNKAIVMIPALSDGSRTIPNATQHNIPAWTIFAMFFIVISLGSSMVKEKENGSFIRLKTLPTNMMVAIVSKQLIYLLVALMQVIVIFSLGIFLFPLIGLPALNLPTEIFGLVAVSIICGLVAVSYAMVIGVFAQTSEQANGFGASSVVILAAIGGVLIPSFAMPSSFAWVIKLSPLHWALESYYYLFLQKGTWYDTFSTLLPMIVILVFLQLIIILGLKQKKLI